MKRFTIIAALLGTGLTCGLAANAATVTYSGGLNGQSNDSYPGSNVLSGNGNISLQQFNTSLGTLNSVTLDLSSVFNYRTRFENRSPNSGSTVDKDIDQRLTIGGNLLDTGNQLYSLTRSVGTYDGAVDYAGTSGFDEAASNGLTSVQLVFTGPGMAQFVGPASLFLAVASYADFNGGFSGGNGTWINSQSFLATALVSYDYSPVTSPVPLPAAVWLLLSGLGLIGAGARRKAV
jgi:hypothetical protein